MRRFSNIITVYSVITALSLALVPYNVNAGATNIPADVTTSKITAEKTISSDKPVTSDKPIIDTTTTKTITPNTSTSDKQAAPASTIANMESNSPASETTKGQKITYLL